MNNNNYLSEGVKVQTITCPGNVFRDIYIFIIYSYQTLLSKLKISNSILKYIDFN